MASQASSFLYKKLVGNKLQYQPDIMFNRAHASQSGACRDHFNQTRPPSSSFPGNDMHCHATRLIDFQSSVLTPAVVQWFRKAKKFQGLLTVHLSRALLLMLSSLLRSLPRLGRRWKPLNFTNPNFVRIPEYHKIDEETLPDYVASHYYPTRIGEIIKERYQIVGKLGFGSTSTAWLARDMEYVFLSSPQIHRRLHLDLVSLYFNYLGIVAM